MYWREVELHASCGAGGFTRLVTQWLPLHRSRTRHGCGAQWCIPIGSTNWHHHDQPVPPARTVVYAANQWYLQRIHLSLSNHQQLHASIDTAPRPPHQHRDFRDTIVLAASAAAAANAEATTAACRTCTCPDDYYCSCTSTSAIGNHSCSTHGYACSYDGGAARVWKSSA